MLKLQILLWIPLSLGFSFIFLNRSRCGETPLKDMKKCIVKAGVSQKKVEITSFKVGRFLLT